MIFYILICILNYAMCLAYNRGYPFKADIKTNHWLMGLSIIVFLIVFVVLFTEVIENNFLGRFTIRYLHTADLKIDLRAFIIAYILI